MLTNPLLEGAPALHTMVDGIDATLIDLAAEEMGEEELVRLAIQLADQTFASRQADLESRALLQNVFELRARRVLGIRSAQRLSWVRETGTRARMLDSVERGLLPRRQTWDDVTDPIDSGLVNAILEWAWTQSDCQAAVREAYRRDAAADTDSIRNSLFEIVGLWLSGRPFYEMASRAKQSVDDLLGIHARVVSFVLQTLVEQGIAMLAKFLESKGRSLAQAVAQFPEHLRFGVPTVPARILAAGGVRHRRAAIELGNVDYLRASDDRMEVFSNAQQLLRADPEGWRLRLGELVFENTRWDLSAVTGTHWE